MSTERWERIKQILDEALRLAPDRRRAYLELACGTDHELRLEVESLISSHQAAGSQFLAAAAPQVLDLTSSSNSLLKAPANQDRKFIGPYRLETKLGEGGMGQVWLAEQTAPVRRQVALKLIRGGIFDSSALQRFQSERQWLAIMDHATIAKVFDAGATPDGQPYFVMEHVPGVPITDYCDQKRLKIPERLELILKVCEGVQHFHQKAIIHRDLKPANILVVEVDGKPLPRILDFGLAKGCTPDVLAEALTLAGGLLGTPGYMSPEQTDPHIQDVDTRTDVYSLGALLYILLTGSLPFDSAQWRKQPLDEALKQLREENPPRPSTRVSTQSDFTAEARGTEPRQLVSLLRGDLDWITLKALEKDRDRRYATATELADDIRRYLRNEPVRAHPTSVWYRGRKFVRRYWVPVAAATIVIVSLSAGLYVANRQRLVAERRFSQLRQLLNEVLFDLNRELGSLPGAIKARSKLVSTSTRYLAGLGAEATHDKKLALEVAQGYAEVARIQGVPSWNHLGQYAEAEESLRRADMSVESVLAAEPRNRTALFLSANIDHDRAVVAYAERRPEQVLAYTSKVLNWFDQLVRLGNLTRQEINAATYIYAELAEVHIALHRFDDAVRYARRGVELSRNTPSIPGTRAQAFNMVAGSLMYLGDFQGALTAIQEARKLVEGMGPVRPALTGTYDDGRYTRLILYQFHCREGLILGEDGGVNLDRPAEAAVAFRQAFDLVEEMAEKQPADFESRSGLATAGRYMGNVLRHSNPKRALEIYDHSLMRIREVPNDVSARREEALLLASSSYAARWIHRKNDASERIERAFRVLRETRDYPAEIIKLGSEADTAVQALADHHAETDQPNKAIELYQELRRKIMASNPNPQGDLLDAAHISQLDANLAVLLRRVGRTDEAITLKGNRLKLWRHWDRKLPGNPFVQRQLAMKSG